MPEVGLRSLVGDASERIVGFCQRLLQAASLSGQERQAADLLVSELHALGYPQATVDGAGNVLACLPGTRGRLSGGPNRTLLLHAHMDVVDPGDPTRWRHPPFSGDRAEGYLWGRGASDTKGSLAAQVYALGLLSEAGLRPSGDVYLAAVVGEEVGGLGTRHLVRSLVPDLAIIGEPSGNTLRRGHRGKLEFVVTLRGRSAHASAPERGLNPHYSMARFLLALREAQMVRDDTFGASSVAPTLSYVDQTSSNVIPSEVTVHLDWRNVPGEAAEQARALVERLAREAAEAGIAIRIAFRQDTVRSYTGQEQVIPSVFPSFCLEQGDPDLLRAQAVLEVALGRRMPAGVWTFATDGGQLAMAGTRCIGFGPGEEAMAHVLDERLQVEQLLEATVGYMALALNLVGSEHECPWMS
jgi:putative selenium metabolism hydrolase